MVLMTERSIKNFPMKNEKKVNQNQNFFRFSFVLNAIFKNWRMVAKKKHHFRKNHTEKKNLLNQKNWQRRVANCICCRLNTIRNYFTAWEQNNWQHMRLATSNRQFVWFKKLFSQCMVQNHGVGVFRPFMDFLLEK